MPRINVSAEVYERIHQHSAFSGMTPSGIVHQALVSLEELDQLGGQVREVAGLLADSGEDSIPPNEPATRLGSFVSGRVVNLSDFVNGSQDG